MKDKYDLIYSTSANCIDQAECDAKAAEMLARIVGLAQKHEVDNPFWVQFCAKAEAAKKGEGPAADVLFLLHSNVFYLWDLLEDSDDDEGVELLKALERDCF